MYQGNWTVTCYLQNGFSSFIWAYKTDSQRKSTLIDQATKRGFQGYQSVHFHHHQSSHNKVNPTYTEKQAITPAEKKAIVEE